LLYLKIVSIFLMVGILSTGPSLSSVELRAQAYPATYFLDSSQRVSLASAPSRSAEYDRFYPLEEPKPKYTANSTLSGEELKTILIEAGFSGHGLRQAWGTVMKESSGRPMAHNDNPKTGDNSYGLFQINMIGTLGVQRMEKYGLSSYEDLFDPLTNAKIGYKVSSGGTNWGPWHGIGERTQYFMSQFPG
jgi:hypothetical protein